MNDDLCVYRHMYIECKKGKKNYTTFMDSEEWNIKHPLYKCTICDGFDYECIGYVPLNKQKRDNIRKKRKKYKQPHNLKEYDVLIRDKVHNAMKHNMDLKKYQVYLKPLRKHKNNHNTKLYKRS